MSLEVEAGRSQVSGWPGQFRELTGRCLNPCPLPNPVQQNKQKFWATTQWVVIGSIPSSEKEKVMERENIKSEKYFIRYQIYYCLNKILTFHAIKNIDCIFRHIHLSKGIGLKTSESE